jgi:AraC-like DNA-binding protein
MPHLTAHAQTPSLPITVGPHAGSNAGQGAVVPVVFAQTYLQVVADHGGSVLEVLRRAGLNERDLASSLVLDMPRYERLVHAVRAVVGDVGIGLEQGWRLPPTSFGSLGLAVLSCDTLRDALALCQRFWVMYGMGLTLGVHEEGDTCAMEFHTLPVVADVDRSTVLEAALASLYRSCTVMQPAALVTCEVWFDFAAPTYADRVRARLNRVQWGMPANQFRFPAAWLDVRMPMANAVNLRAAVAQCEREAAVFAMNGPSLSSQVQQQLIWREQGYLKLEEVSQRLNVSPRTLRRHLQAEGVSFLMLQHRARVRDAKALLRQPGLDVQAVAARLGYADPANFTRAFRQWTGITPSAFRLRPDADASDATLINAT